MAFKDTNPGFPGENVRDVLCVGAGPVGLLLALLIKKSGGADSAPARGTPTSVTVVDRQPARYPLPRAVCLDHEGQRILRSTGLGPKLTPLLENIIGLPGTNFSWKDADGKSIVDLEWEKPTASGLNRACGFCQPELEKLLEDACRDAGVDILQLSSLHQNDDHVTATFNKWPRKEDGSSTKSEATVIRTRYLVGCDGANSTVRSLCGIDFNDLGFQYDWLVCDMLIKGHGLPPKVLPHRNGAQICDPNRPTTFALAGNGRHRVEFMRLPAETKEEFFSESRAWELLRPWGFSEYYVDMERVALYTFRARWAGEWRKGRVFLAGDACHQMPPFLGQGMNSGLRDATALAWRLRLALDGKASEFLLDSYSTERLAHVRAIINHSVLLGKVICETDEAKAAAYAKDLRANPPPHGFDPHLGTPGIWEADDPAAGLVAWQRPVTTGLDGGKADLFDQVYGAGWRLLVWGDTPGLRLSPAAKEFFNAIGGKVIALKATDDVSGDYCRWFKEDLNNAKAVLWRPDFYIYGVIREKLEEAEDMLLGLKEKISPPLK
ncbi:uncharacterized protein PgNI_05119 [Pyricularia grisea]|uniref:FAD-binding domain-containing protein n=1 Tax=Pyricularia grisea TaxID=148305 RepID=A0A6P8BEN1_PYRGI|nr:uncharacterized protein PgNI_05119 [Pyricularia grisea]TLD14346.1 hypothetical protein PgNI_05119 [Pyricularia grisea]